MTPPKDLPADQEPLKAEQGEIKRGLALGARGVVGFVPPTPEEAKFIREGLARGMKMVEIKEAWKLQHQLPQGEDQ